MEHIPEFDGPPSFLNQIWPEPIYSRLILAASNGPVEYEDSRHGKNINTKPRHIISLRGVSDVAVASGAGEEGEYLCREIRKPKNFIDVDRACSAKVDYVEFMLVVSWSLAAHVDRFSSAIQLMSWRPYIKAQLLATGPHHVAKLGPNVSMRLKLLLLS